MELIDKDKVITEIERRIGELFTLDKASYEVGLFDAYKIILSFINTLEVKEVDLDESARHYLLHEHTSTLNEVLHQADLKVEMQYHKDIEDAYKAGLKLGLKAKGE